MKIVFMGSPDYAVKILDNLVKHFEVVAVFTQPDKPVGRKKILTPTL
jgi:methionyl-tRNA formyltransferase